MLRPWHGWLTARENSCRTGWFPARYQGYDSLYTIDASRHMIRYVYQLDRDAIFEDLFERLAGNKKT